MMAKICDKLNKDLQDLKQERKTVRVERGNVTDYRLQKYAMLSSKAAPDSFQPLCFQHLSDAKKAQQNLESSFKHLESVS